MKKLNQKTLGLHIVLFVSLPSAALEVMQFDMKINTKTRQEIQQETTQVSLTSIITLRLLKADKQGEWWGVKADNVRLNKLHSDPSYEVPFVFHVNNQGLISRFWFPHKLNDMYTKKLQGLAYYFQWQKVQPEQNITERDNTGTYNVKYHSLEDGTISKEKLSYQANKDYRIKILESENQIIQANKFFQHSAGVEIFLFEHNISMMNLMSEQSYEIKLRDTILPSTLLDLPKDYTRWQLDLQTENPVDKAVTDIAFQRKMLIEMLANKDLSSIPSRELAFQLLNFTNGFDVIEVMLTKNQIDEASTLRLFNALGQIDNGDSQLLLSNLVTNMKINNNAKFLAMRALSKGKSALTLESSKNILILLEDSTVIDDTVLKSSIIHGIGSILGKRLPNQFSTDIKDTLLTKMRSHNSDLELSTLISSIGNTRDPEYIIELEDYKNSTSPEVRASLAETLGRIKSEHSYTLLTDMLSKESSGSAVVQSSILKSLKQYPINDKLIDIVLRYIDKSANNSVRFDAISLISDIKISKKQKDTLHNLLAKETNRKNFVALANLINK